MLTTLTILASDMGPITSMALIPTLDTEDIHISFMNLADHLFALHHCHLLLLGVRAIGAFGPIFLVGHMMERWTCSTYQNFKHGSSAWIGFVQN